MKYIALRDLVRKALPDGWILLPQYGGGRNSKGLQEVSISVDRARLRIEFGSEITSSSVETHVLMSIEHAQGALQAVREHLDMP